MTQGPQVSALSPIEWVLLSMLVFRATGLATYPLWVFYAVLFGWVALLYTDLHRRKKKLLQMKEKIDADLDYLLDRLPEPPDPLNDSNVFFNSKEMH